MRLLIRETSTPNPRETFIFSECDTSIFLTWKFSLPSQPMIWFTRCQGGNCVTWRGGLNIIVDVARGVHYLHRDSRLTITERNKIEFTSEGFFSLSPSLFFFFFWLWIYHMTFLEFAVRIFIIQTLVFGLSRWQIGPWFDPIRYSCESIWSCKRFFQTSSVFYYLYIIIILCNICHKLIYA